MKILSVFIHPHVVPNLCVYLFCLYTKEDIWKNVLIKQISFPIDYHSRKNTYYASQWGMRSVWLKHSSKYLPLSSAEQINTLRFGTTWGWVNTDRIFIFGWTNPLSIYDVCVLIVTACSLNEFMTGQIYVHAHVWLPKPKKGLRS